MAKEHPTTRPTWLKKHHLWAKVYPRVPMFSDRVLSSLGEILGQNLRQWSGGLRVARHDDAKGVVVAGGPEALRSAIEAAAPTAYGLGSVVIRGAYPGVRIYLDSWDGTTPPGLNMLAAEVASISAVEGQSPPDWMIEFFRGMVRALPTRYANARLVEEFKAKNTVDDETGTRALGVKLDVSLPGLYWLNYFGAEYVELWGRETLMSVPAHSVESIGDGFLVVLAASPMSWNAAEYRELEQKTLDRIGRQYFFQRDDQARSLVPRGSVDRHSSVEYRPEQATISSGGLESRCVNQPRGRLSLARSTRPGAG